MSNNQAVSRIDKTRYFCDGPQGHFWIEDINMARRLLDIIDPDGEDWTITDTKMPPVSDFNLAAIEVIFK